MDWIQLAQNRFLCTYGNNIESSLTGTALHECIHMIIFPHRFCFTEVFSQTYWFIRKGSQGVIWGWTSMKHENWQSIQWQRQVKGFLKGLSARTAGELLIFNRKQLRIMMRLLTQHCNSMDICLSFLSTDILPSGTEWSPGHSFRHMQNSENFYHKTQENMTIKGNK